MSQQSLYQLIADLQATLATTNAELSVINSSAPLGSAQITGSRPVALASDHGLVPINLFQAATAKEFAASTNDISSGTGGAESAQVLFKNPLGSGKRMRISKLMLCTNVSSNNNIFRLYWNPTVTNTGTALTICPLWMRSSPVASVMQVFKVPTCSSNGTFFSNFCVGATSTLLVPFEQQLILEAGQQLLVAVRPNAANTTFNVNGYWTEE